LKERRTKSLHKKQIMEYLGLPRIKTITLSIVVGSFEAGLDKVEPTP
jgi:hypothetical protein